MKKIIITAFICLLLGVSIGWLFFHAAPAGGPDRKEILYYRDPMNPQITSPLPKKSSDGMDFVAVYSEGTSASAQSTRKIAYYQDPMHPWYTSDKPGKAPDCGMDLVPVYEGENNLGGIKIDPVTVQNIGVKTEVINKRQLEKTIRTTGRIDYDETRVYTVNTKIMGWVEKLHVDYSGQVVRKGDPLLEIYSPELVTTQQEYLQAIRYQSQLAGSGNDEVKKGADELVQSTKQRLLNWDIPEGEIDALEKQGTVRKTMTINSPANGVVIDKMVLPGQNIMPGMTLYKIADLSTLWILADIYEYELPWVKVGQKADIELSYIPGKSISGSVTYIYPYLNAETRTIRVRIQIRNTSDLQFKPEMFVTVKLVSPLVVNALAVPEQAVIRSGERNIIVVSLGGGYFDPREVKLGLTADGYTQILEGAHEGEVVVTSSQFLIDSESNLKAAISSLSGHAGMDMSKPMEEPKNSGNQPEQSGAVAPVQKPVDHTGYVLPASESDSIQHLDKNDHQKTENKQQQVDKQKKQVIYTCVMHPQIRSDQPGDCPLCGMKLVPVTADSSESPHVQQ